jgi:uncharacterized membrane protein
MAANERGNKTRERGEYRSEARGVATGRDREATPGEGSDEIARRNVAFIEQLEREENAKRGRGERVAEWVTRRCGSTPFLLLHVVWFAAWIACNSIPGLPRWDEFPFSFLTLTVSLEAIFLTIFILIAQNRQAELADQRNKLDLQINLLAEQESSKTIALLEAIMKHLGVETDDPEISALATPTHPDQVLAQIKEMAERSGIGDDPDDADDARAKRPN